MTKTLFYTFLFFLLTMLKSMATTLSFGGDPSSYMWQTSTGATLPDDVPVLAGYLTDPNDVETFTVFAEGNNNGIIFTIGPFPGRWGGTDADTTAGADAFNNQDIVVKIEHNGD